jgi:GTPase SAR1 family protein
LTPMCYRSAKVAVVVYDLTDANSFQRCARWLEDLIHCELNLIVALVGNKSDQCVASMRAVNSDQVCPIGELGG